MIRYREIRPRAELAAFVDAIWTLEHDGIAAPPQRVVPDGHPELILNLSQPFEFSDGLHWRGQPRCFLAGQIDGPLLLRPNGRAKMLGIRFHPHGPASLIDSPMHELAGQFTPVADLAPRLARDLECALHSPDPLARVQNALLAARAGSRAGDPLIAEAIRRIVRARGASDLAALCRDLGVGTRQFERRFHRAVGLQPKLFCRMRRFVKRLPRDQPATRQLGKRGPRLRLL